VRQATELKTALLNALIFVGLALWSVVAHPWAAPGFAAMAVSRLLQLGIVSGRLPEKDLGTTAFLTLLSMYVGITYLAALFVGLPDTGRFWTVFGACLTILMPVVALMRHSLFRKPTVRE
jgi:hypothetical protein